MSGPKTYEQSPLEKAETHQKKLERKKMNNQHWKEWLEFEESLDEEESVKNV